MSVASISDAVAIGFAQQCDRGKVREENQDSVLQTVVPLGELLVVADGIGGYEGGGIASRMAVEAISASLATMPTFFPPAIAIQEAASRANAEIAAAAAEPDTPNNRMGTTVVLALLQPEPDRAAPVQALIGHIGDSRAYRFHRGRLTCITRDHSAVQLLLDHNFITPEEALHHPDASVLTRTLGQEQNVEIEINSISLQPGDTLLLCSDGLWGYVADSEIERVLADTTLSAEEASRALLDLALDAGGHDNVSIQIARLAGTWDAEALPTDEFAPESESRYALEPEFASFYAPESSGLPAPEPRFPSVSEAVSAFPSAFKANFATEPGLRIQFAPDPEPPAPRVVESDLASIADAESALAAAMLATSAVEPELTVVLDPEPASSSAAALPLVPPAEAKPQPAPASHPETPLKRESVFTPAQQPRFVSSHAVAENRTPVHEKPESRLSMFVKLLVSLTVLFASPLERESEHNPTQEIEFMQRVESPESRITSFLKFLVAFLVPFAPAPSSEPGFSPSQESDLSAKFANFEGQVSLFLKLMGILLLAFGTSCGLVYFAVLQNWFGVGSFVR